MGVSGEGGEVLFMQSLGCWLYPQSPLSTVGGGSASFWECLSAYSVMGAF